MTSPLKDSLALFELKKKAPPHEISASCDEIIKICPLDKKHGYGYWLRLVKKSGKSYNDILYLTGKAKGLDEKFNKCGFVVNQLKK